MCPASPRLLIKLLSLLQWYEILYLAGRCTAGVRPKLVPRRAAGGVCRAQDENRQVPGNCEDKAGLINSWQLAVGLQLCNPTHHLQAKLRYEMAAW